MRGRTAGRVQSGLVHFYTASGAVLALLAAAELTAAAPDLRCVFLLLTAAVLIDATDGPLARRFEVARVLPTVRGRTIDDIVDYLTYTFVPLLVIWRMDWLPAPAALWIAPALVTSLFAFAYTEIKDEAGGFFVGFPSYWNVVAFYAGFWHGALGRWGLAAIVLALAALTVMPVRFIYPNLAPPPWRVPVLGGAYLWTMTLVALLATYPAAPAWLVALSFVYPAFYIVLSLRLGATRGRR